MKTEAVIAVIGAVGATISSKPFRKMMLGTYTDGTARSLADALNGEYRSPTSKASNKKKKKKSMKKSKKKLKKTFKL